MNVSGFNFNHGDLFMTSLRAMQTESNGTTSVAYEESLNHETTTKPTDIDHAKGENSK